MDGPITPRLFPLLPLLLLLSVPRLCLGAAPCPRSCACPQPTELHCTFRSLPSVPNNIHRSVERINLGFNSISRLSERSLSGLTQLEMLLIHGNDLHSLPDGAFKDLSALQMLKLSYNKLREVSRHTFVGLWSLARLHLDHNGLESIDPDAFHGLTSLRLLQLEGNRLKQLHPSTFSTFSIMEHFHVSTLKHLYLSNNSLSTLPKETLENMPQLENLFLHGNPWVCDCNMKWVHRWLQTAPGVLKCKKDRSLPAGQLCPLCSSPQNLHQKPLQALDNMVCSGPVIKSKSQHTTPDEADNDSTFLDDFKHPFGNISLGLSDEHGNEVELECSVNEPKQVGKFSFEQVDDTTLGTNVTLSLDLDCDVDRERYERLWRLIAYYSSVPAHLKRGVMLTKDPYPTYVYKQDSDKDALYYTGVKANIMALPTWLMQVYTDIQLNRHGSSGKKVKLILTTQLSQNLDLEMVRRQPRTWVVVEETNSTYKTTLLGKTIDLQCSVQSAGEPVITWILPDGTKLVAPSGNTDERLSISPDGRLVIKAAEHKDAGSYHCIAKVGEDLAVLAFFVSVQESSNPQQEEKQDAPTELFAGNALNLDCEALGSPDPDVNWIIPNGNIVSFRSNSSRIFVYSNGTLHIPQSLPPDNGFYKCVAFNRYGVDTKSAKVVVNRRPGMARPLRRFPMKPQSAAGVNTKIKVPINNLDEGSGDIEEASDSKPVRTVVPVRNGVHPSRNTRRRPPIMVRKPNSQNAESGKNILDHRRRMNMAKINPERWADILAKIRVKNGKFVTTASPVIATTAKLTTQFREVTTFGQVESSIEKYSQDLTTLAHEAIEGSSDGIRQKASREITSAPIFELESTQTLPMTTPKPLTSQSFPDLQPSSSSNAFFLPQTTSAPLQALTLWQANQNTQKQEDIELDGGKPADSKRLKAKGNRKNKTRLSKLKRVKSGQVVPTIAPVTPNWEDKTIFSTQKPKLEAVISVVSPTTAQIWQDLSAQQQNAKRRNGNHKKKPNRRKNKLNKTDRNNALVGETLSQVTAMPTEQKVDSLAISKPSVEFEKGQLSTESTAGHRTNAKSHSKSSKTRLSKNNRVQDFITTAFPETRLDTFPSNSQNEFTSHPLPPVKPLAQTPMQNTIADGSSEKRRHAKGKLIQSRRGYTAPEGQKHLVNGSREQLVTGSTPVASLTEHKVEEMYYSQDKSELIATTGIDFEVLTATKRPKTSYKTSSRAAIEDVTEIASTPAALTMTISYIAGPKMASAEPEQTENDKLSATITASTKTPQSQSESPISTSVYIPNTTATPKMFSLSTQKVASGFNDSRETFTEDQQTQDELLMLSSNAITQTTTNLIRLEIEKQSRAIPTNPISLQIADTKMTDATSLLMDSTELSPSISIIAEIAKTTIPPLLRNEMTKQAPTKMSDKDQNNENLPMSPPYSTLNTTFMPSIKSYTTPSISASRKTVKQDENIQAKSTNSSHTFDQNSALPSMLPSNINEHTASVSISSEVEQSSQAKLLQTSVTPLFEATQRSAQPTPALLDPVTQSSNHKTNQFVSPNPTIPAINSKTTLAPTHGSLLANWWTEKPRARPTPKLPASAAYPKGKPRITKGNFQTMSVKAETDAVLPCAANGEPQPFLSWTKVSTGTSIPQNTRLQRFEVHKNGTLIIRNTQPLDGGEYLCTVQNQHGSDQMLTNLVVLSQHPKILQPRHRDFSVNLGSNIDIDCQVEGHPRPRVSWVLPNHAQIAASPYGLVPNRVSILPNGTLRIIQAGFSDRGIYKCVGSSTSGADTVSVRLYVSALPPVFKQMPIENITATENGAVFLNCAANGSPQPTIRWTTPDGIQLTSSQYLNGRKTLVFPNGTLFMQSLTQGNAGKYECLASNFLGTSKRTVNLMVKSQMLMAKASITMSSAKLTEVAYGGELRLDCAAQGNPQPRVIWRMPSKKLVDSQYSFDPRIRVFPNGSLTIGSVTDHDGGDYLCMARNKIGDDYVVLRVAVLTKPATIEQKMQRSSQEVVYGGDLKVDCVASGHPNPEISWALPDGTMVNPEKQRERVSAGRRRRYVVFDNGTLFFNDVGMREEGDYTCYAENELGKDEMKIHIKVKTATSPPQILHKAPTSPVQVLYGADFTLHCSAKGEPTPVFTWISPTNRIIVPNQEKYQVMNDGTLVVRKAQRFDAGDYTCTARNSAGQDTKVIKVEVLVTPPVISNAQGHHFKVSTVQNERIWLDCIAKGTPTPRIMWVLPGNVILPAPYHSNRMTVYQNGTLEIRSVKRSDSGQLACIARNEGGEVRLAVSLDVKDANARLLVSGAKTKTVSLTAGSTMTLNCSFDGNNFPSVTWVLPSGTPLTSGVRFMKFFHRQDGSLLISNPSLAEAGTYRCLGRKNGGQFERVVQLTPGRKPEITNRYSSAINVLNGEMLMLHCVTNIEPLRLAWTLPSGVILTRPQKAGRYSVLQNGTLAIQQVSLYDRGLYVCRAANEYGSSVMSVSVIVIAYPPRISNGPNSVTFARRGEAIQLSCEATGIPSVEVAWETPDKTRLVVSTQPRFFGNKYLNPKGSLVIQNPTQRDAGVYKCTARNAIGVDSKTTYLNVY